MRSLLVIGLYLKMCVHSSRQYSHKVLFPQLETAYLWLKGYTIIWDSVAYTIWPQLGGYQHLAHGPCMGDTAAPSQEDVQSGT